MSLDEHRAANLANWNERVAGHTANDGYGIAALVADPDHISDVVAFDRDAFGAVGGAKDQVDRWIRRELERAFGA